MNPARQIAEMLTDDPDIFRKSAILAVHPNYVVDAAAAASRENAEGHEQYGPQRMKILKTYIDRFKRFIDGQHSSGATIIITMMGEPYQLHNWYDEQAHWRKEDVLKIGMEQEEVLQYHKDLVDYIYQMAAQPNVWVVEEEDAGEACRSGKLDHLIKDADEIQVIGGNLTGCLRHTVKSLSRDIDGPSVKIVKELTFDDDSEFWKRQSS